MNQPFGKVSHNIFDTIPDDFPDEFIDILTQTGGMRVERIVSRGHTSPPEFWYDQPENEFVILLKGSAGLRFKRDDDTTVMQTGDWVVIPAGEKHRVEWTDPDQDTVWLAVHYT